MNCKRCKKTISEGELCNSCFSFTFEKRIRKHIRLNKLFTPKDRIICLSDLTYHVLRRICSNVPIQIERQKSLGEEAIAVTKAVSINRYCAAEAVRMPEAREAEDLGIDQKISKDEGGSESKKKEQKRSYHQDDNLSSLSDEVMLVQRSLDDEIHDFLKAILSGTIPQTYRHESIFRVVTDDELRRYAELKNLVFDAQPKDKDIMRIIDDMHSRYPETKHAFLRSVDVFRPIVDHYKSENIESNRTCS